MPKVSVVTPIYNRAHLIEQIIVCVFAQTYQDFELIIVDDGSTDNTKDIVQRYCDEYPGRIKYLYQTNQGQGSARNAGIKAAAGEIIAFLDSDDEWMPLYIEKSVAILESADCQWVVTSAKRIDIDKDGKEIESHIIKSSLQKEKEYFNKQLSLYESLLTGNIVGETSRIVVRKKCLDVVGGFREDLRLSQDYELWLRLAKAGYKLGEVVEPLVIYRKSMDSVTKTRFTEALRCGYRIIMEYSPDAIELDPQFKKFYGRKLWNYARDLLKQPNKDYGLFLKCIYRSLSFDWNWARLMSPLNGRNKGL